MAQSSAAREPTMEEILASIRRIIESNDESAPPRAEQRPQLASVAVTPSLVGEENMVFDSAEITEVRPAPAEKPAAAVPARAISLADVAARLRSREEPAASAADAAPVVANDDRGPAADDALDDDAFSIDPIDLVFEDEAFDSAAPDEVRAAEQDAAPEAALGDPDHRRASGLAAPAGNDAEVSDPVRREAFAAGSNAADPAEPAAQTHGSGLVSAETGTKVAAAFDDLNAAIAEGRMRSFEELAQELLRPMLSDWLDDNLPTLVERLVREEIERVARGGRR